MARQVTLNRRLVNTGVAWGFGLLIFFPILWTILTSFRTEAEAISLQPSLFGFDWTLENYQEVNSRSNYPRYFMNSVIIAVGSTLLGLLNAVPAAWSMAFVPFKKTRGILMWIVGPSGCGKSRLLRLIAGLEDVTECTIQQVTQFISENFPSDITLSDMARLVAMNDSAFSRFFAKATGNSFIRFVSRVRISKACELLSDTTMPITTICYETGFNNVANFNRRFRELKGSTPREYRQQSRLRHGARSLGD